MSTIVTIPDGAPICCCGVVGGECSLPTEWTSVTAAGLTCTDRSSDYPTAMANGDTFSHGTPTPLGTWYGENDDGTLQVWLWAWYDTPELDVCGGATPAIVYSYTYCDCTDPENCEAQYTQECCIGIWDGSAHVFYDGLPYEAVIQ